MKNVEIYLTPKQIRNKILAITKTQEFRDILIHPELNLLNLLVPDTYLPIIFYDYEEPYEWSHFTTYFRFIANRKYDNDYIHDLYLIHELCHLAQIKYKTTDFYTWYFRINEQELNSSFFSEVVIYWLADKWGINIREKTFKGSIWYDELIENNYLPQGKSDIPLDKYNNIITFIQTDSYLEESYSRRKALMAGILTPNTEAERGIVRYKDQNFEWASIWKHIYNQIELAGEYLQPLCNLNLEKLLSYDKMVYRVENYIKLLNPSVDFKYNRDQILPIFFEKQAKEFYEVYSNNNILYSSPVIKHQERDK